LIGAFFAKDMKEKRTLKKGKRKNKKNKKGRGRRSGPAP
jgi:hypothetical protein